MEEALLGHREGDCWDEKVEKDDDFVMMSEEDEGGREKDKVSSSDSATATIGGESTFTLFRKNGMEIRRVLQDAIYGQILHVVVDKTSTELAVKATTKELASSGICLKGTPVFEDHSVELEILRKVRERSHSNLLELAEDRFQLETETLRFVGLPFARGGELFSLVKERGSLSEDLCVDILGGIARGLHHLHECLGFCHNDISLENILLKEDRRTPVICDYGLAQAIGTSWDTNKHISGKLPYQAPEIYSGTAKVASGKGDIFSVGVALFVMLSGIPPFEVPDSLYDMRYKYIQSGKMKNLLKLWRISISDEAVHLLSGMLIHEPSCRMSVRQILDHPWTKRGNSEGVLSSSELTTTISSSPSSVFNFDSAYTQQKMREGQETTE